MKINFSRLRGFSLIEMAIVLAIVGLLMSQLLPSLSNQISQQRRNETAQQLDKIQQAILGYAITYDRLPCPAATGNFGMESFATGKNATDGTCLSFYDGFVPAATLGITPVDSQGFAIDAWNNRIRYAVTAANSQSFTKTGGMQTTGLSTLAANLLVCSTASTSSSSCSVANSALTSTPGVPIVIFSTGENGSVGNDELKNTDGDRVFVSHTPTPNSAPNGIFDDLVIWLSPSILFNRMVSAGKLP